MFQFSIIIALTAQKSFSCSKISHNSLNSAKLASLIFASGGGGGGLVQPTLMSFSEMAAEPLGESR